MTNVPSERIPWPNEDLRSLFGHAAIGIMNGDLSSGTVFYVNPACCEVLGISPDEVEGKSVLKLPLSEDANRLLHGKFGELMNGDIDRFDVHIDLRNDDNDTGWAEFEVYSSGDSIPKRFIALVRDVSVRVRSELEREALRNKSTQLLGQSQRELDAMQRELGESVRRRHEFLAVLSHELRNPLAPIQNATRVARTPTATPDELQWSLAVIERQVQNMARLLDDLMDVTRIVRGSLELHIVRTSLNDAIAGAVETARPFIEAKNHRLTVDIPEETMWVDGDPVRLAQIFGNLLNNAASHSERGSEIGIRASHSNSRWTVHICDNGAGISPELLPHVFEMFVQARRPGSVTGGLGIGLALVDGLVKLHYGSIMARSDGAGRGSEFTVVLPAPGVTPVTWNGDMSQANADRARTLRILVADDNVDAAESLAVLLRLQGHDVRVAHDGLGAVREAEAFRPEVALVDIGMPIMNGHDVARWIRSQPWGGNMLVIALTGWNQPMDRVQTSLSGFDKHLAKPVSIDDLTACFSERRNSGVET